MKKNRRLRSVITILLTIVLALNGMVFGETVKAEAADTNYIYFYNSNGWAQVNAYVYGDAGELLGGWPGATAEAATEIGDSWVKVAVTQTPPFNIIFFDANSDSNRAELYLDSADSIYVTTAALAYSSSQAAEESINGNPTTIYFLNTADGSSAYYDNVYCYTYKDGATVGESWPGTKASEATDLGDNWYQVTIDLNATESPFNIIFNNGNGSQLSDVYLESYTNNYIAINDGAPVRYESKADAEASIGLTKETTLYFLNNNDWPTVNCYVYGAPGEAMGSWPGTATVSASELGEKWLKATVPAETPFNIIFFNTENDRERTELYVGNANQIYLTGSNAAYTSQLEAELSVGLADQTLMTTLYFYNSRGWGDINGYFYGTDADGTSYTIGSGWPGSDCEKATDLGDNWWTIQVPKDASESPFYAIFNDGVEQTTDVLISDKENIYVIANGETYKTKEEALTGAANDTYDDGCEDGENTDYAAYQVTYTGAGASLPYVTYEAEAGKTTGTVLADSRIYKQDIQSEASGRSAVKLDASGEYVEITLTEAADSLVLRYCIPDSSDGAGLGSSIAFSINGTEKEDIALTSKYAWVYGSYPYYNNVSQGGAHRFFDELRLKLDATYPAGTKLRLTKKANDGCDYVIVDLMECELIPDVIAQHANSLSVTDYGAVANDGQDDYDAFVSCIAAAQEAGKTVYIPEGRFDLTENRSIVAESVTIQGAGMWHTELYGAGAAFKYSGTSKFYDFAMTGVATIRRDSDDPAAFEGNGKKATNVTIQNIWIEHTKVGVWSANTDGLIIQGCRIRNTYADGINMCSATNNAVVRNNSLRNTGDDCIAIWPWLGNCEGNTIEHNTISVPTLANGIAVYGGGNHLVRENLVCDTINNGAGIVVGTEFSTSNGYTGKVTVSNNELRRCGSMQTDENYAIGAIWMWASFNNDMNTEYVIENNRIYDSSYEGILLECNKALENVSINDNVIDKATNAITVFAGTDSYGLGTGSATYSGLEATNLTGDLISNGNPNFTLTEVEKESEEEVTEPEEKQEEEVTEPEEKQEEEVTEPEEKQEEEVTEPEEKQEEEVTEPEEKQEETVTEPDTWDNWFERFFGGFKTRLNKAVKSVKADIKNKGFIKNFKEPVKKAAKIVIKHFCF